MADEEAEGLQDGTYIVVSRIRPQGDRVLDVPGARDVYTGPLNVQTFARNGTEAQVCVVRSTDDGDVALFFPLVNKIATAGYLEGDAGSMKPIKGSNVIFQDPTGQEQGLWTPSHTASDGSITVDGQILPCYRLACKLDGTLFMQATGGSATGAPVKVNTADAGTGDFEWAFLPIDGVPAGTYRILSAVTTRMQLGVAASSQGAGSSLQSQGKAATDNTQVWVVGYPEEGTGRCRITNAGSGLAVTGYSKGGKTSAGAKVTVQKWAGSTGQLWLTDPVGTVRHEGTDYPSYWLRTPLGEDSLVISPCDAMLRPQTNVTLQRQDKALAYIFVPTEAFASDMAAPAAATLMVGGIASDLHGVAEGPVSAYPTWVGGTGQGAPTKWQLRYRTRARRAGQQAARRSPATWDGSPWRSILDDSMANEGWGEVGTANCAASASGGRWVSDRPIQLKLTGSSPAAGDDALTTGDLVEVQFEVRGFADEWGEDGARAHGATRAATCTVALVASVNVTALNFGLDGAAATYTSTATRGGNTVRIWSDGYFDTGAAAGSAAAGRLVDGTLEGIPSQGQSLIVGWSIMTVDGVSNSGSQPVAATCDLDGADLMTATEWETEEDALLHVRLQHQVSQRLWLELADGEAIEIEPGEDGTFDVPYPMRAQFAISALALDGDGKLWRWRSQHAQMGGRTRWFNWEGGALRLHVREGEHPSESVDTSSNTDEQWSTARRWQLVRVGSSKAQTRTVSGTVVDMLDVGTREAVSALARQRFVWYRDPSGEVCRVAVSGVQEDRHADWVDVTVDMRRVDA